METFETDFDNNSYLDEIALAISENGEETINVSEDYLIDEIDLNFDAMSSSDLINTIGEVFEKNLMNEHLATIDLLGNLGYTDMLMYYCAVMDCVFINSELDKNEQPIEIIPPDQYVKETETAKDKVFDLEIEVSKAVSVKELEDLDLDIVVSYENEQLDVDVDVGVLFDALSEINQEQISKAIDEAYLKFDSYIDDNFRV